jgi:geranylgeranyl reductase
MKKHFEVIVVGAGPGGLNCAKILGDHGKKVLLLEANPEVGPKVCAAGLTLKSKRYLNPPGELLEHQFHDITIHSPWCSATISFNDPHFFAINRTQLGQWQLSQLNRTVVDVQTSARVTNINDTSITINHQDQVTFDYLVGADGANSIVRKYLGLKNDMVGAAIQYLLPLNAERKHQRNELFFNSALFHCWYAWIFPHKEHLSIGYGYAPSHCNPIKMKANFNDWLQKMNIDVSQATYEAFIINSGYHGYKFGNMYLCGDAAGLASGFTGEGIYQALVSAEDVAHSILDQNYQPKFIPEVLKQQHLHFRIIQALHFAGPLRNAIFNAVIFASKIPFIGKTVIRTLA